MGKGSGRICHDLFEVQDFKSASCSTKVTKQQGVTSLGCAHFRIFLHGHLQHFVHPGWEDQLVVIGRER
tara:strand:+ start:366 stop:572 length:207 start_codon:yes stop_codon:yes gene_type:complete